MSGKKPRISITERNQQTAAILDSDPRYRKGIESPFGVASQGIELKDPGWTVRWFNSAIMADHVWRNKQIGWDEVKPDDLLHPEQAGAFGVSPSGSIVRGERGQEVLLKIPKEVNKARQLAKTARNLREMKDFDKQKQNMLSAAAANYGSEAADYLNDRVGPVGSVKTYAERIEVREDEE